jgi:glutamate N-acetyltransferase/amino-acid N-acetyltransferase
VIAAAGRAGVAFDPEKVTVAFDDVVIFKDGQWTGNQMENRVSEVIRQSEFTVAIDLGQGLGTDRVFTCDFSVDYVHINADYRT